MAVSPTYAATAPQTPADVFAANFISIKSSDLLSKWYGESEQQISRLFARARQVAPCVVFIDEIDSIAPKRDRVPGEAEKRLVAQLLTLMDGLEARSNLVVIAATNRPDAIDEALRRPGRFDREIVIGVPDEQGRREILGIHTRGMPLGDRVDLGELARATYGFVGAARSELTMAYGMGGTPDAETGYVWGLGAEMMMTERMSVGLELARREVYLDQTSGLGAQIDTATLRVGFRF